jgi:CheY-like chemotaxis protein
MSMRATILLVDDFRYFRIHLREILEAEGCCIIEALNGKQAIKIASRDCPDLIIMDLSMPVMNGFEAARQIRKMGEGFKRCPS